MFIPYFIAILLGLVCPSSSSNYHTNTQMVSTTSNGDPEEGDPSDDDGAGGGTGGGTGGTTGNTGNGNGTGGNTGTNPPPRP